MTIASQLTPPPIGDLLSQLPGTESEIGNTLVMISTTSSDRFEIVTYDPELKSGYGRRWGQEPEDFDEGFFYLLPDRAGVLMIFDSPKSEGWTIASATLEDLDQTEWIFPE